MAGSNGRHEYPPKKTSKVPIANWWVKNGKAAGKQALLCFDRIKHYSVRSEQTAVRQPRQGERRSEAFRFGKTDGYSDLHVGRPLHDRPPTLSILSFMIGRPGAFRGFAGRRGGSPWP